MDDQDNESGTSNRRPSRIPFRFRSEPPPASRATSGEGEENADAYNESNDARTSRVEQLLRDVIRKAVDRGADTLNAADSAVRNVADLKLPKELVMLFFTQLDDTKNGVVRVVAKEVRDFLEATDLATEIQRALTALSFEVKTEIRFVPNESGRIKPKVTSVSRPKKKDNSSVVDENAASATDEERSPDEP